MILVILGSNSIQVILTHFSSNISRFSLFCRFFGKTVEKKIMSTTNREILSQYQLKDESKTKFLQASFKIYVQTFHKCVMILVFKSENEKTVILTYFSYDICRFSLFSRFLGKTFEKKIRSSTIRQILSLQKFQDRSKTKLLLQAKFYDKYPDFSEMCKNFGHQG